jgi:FkbM family methyltransferase
MFGILGEKLSVITNKLPIPLRAIASSVANIIDEIDVVINFRLHKGWCFIDIGAYVGAYSILGSRKVGEKGIVIAIEPHPKNFMALSWNVKRKKNVVPLRIAIWNQNTYAKLYESSSNALHSLVRVGDKQHSIKVLAVTLDTLYNALKQLGVNQIDAIKIDVEGAEIEVLKGCKETLKTTKLIIIEVHNDKYLNKIFYLLKEHKFQISSLKSNHIMGVKSPSKE